MCAALEVGDIPHVLVVGGDVEVAEDRERTRAGGRLCREPVQRRKPPQFVQVVRVLQRAPVGHVDADHLHTTAHRREEPRLGRVVVVGETTHVRKVGYDLVDPDPRQDGHPVPATIPAVHGFISQLTQVLVRELLVGDLGLLQAEDIRFHDLQPHPHPGHTAGQGVDVPGDDAHRPIVPNARTGRQAVLRPSGSPSHAQAGPPSPNRRSSRCLPTPRCHRVHAQ